MEDPKAQEHGKDQQKSDVYISIGGRVGPGSAIGKDNRVEAQIISEGTYTAGTSSENLTREDFVSLLQQLQEQIAQLQDQFEPDDATDAQDALAKARQISMRDNPPIERLKQNLETVRSIIENTAKAGATLVAPLGLLMQKVFTMFPHLFGG